MALSSFQNPGKKIIAVSGWNIDIKEHFFEGLEVEERRIDIQEIADAYDAGKLDEVFGTGTAAVISPVGHLKWKDKVMEINGNKIGKISQMLYDTMTGIQWGTVEDKFGWIVPVE